MIGRVWADRRAGSRSRCCPVTRTTSRTSRSARTGRRSSQRAAIGRRGHGRPRRARRSRRLAGDTEAVVVRRVHTVGAEMVTASLDGTARTWDAVVQPLLPVVADLRPPVTQRRASRRPGVRSRRRPVRRAYRDRAPARAGGRRRPGPSAGHRGHRPGRRTRGDRREERHGHASRTGRRSSSPGIRAEVTSVAFSADGARVVTASRRPRRAGSGMPARAALLHVLRGHFAIVSDARFSPDGRWVVTAGPATAGLWDADTGLARLLLRGHEGKLRSRSPSRRTCEPDRDGRQSTARSRLRGYVPRSAAAPMTLIGSRRRRASRHAAVSDPTDEERRAVRGL